MTGRPYTLIPDAVSHETIEALEQLAAQARAGEVIGVGFVALLKRRRYIANTAGECRNDPTLTRGMVLALDDELRSLVHGRSFDDTHL
jgi:hypothetical protein